MNRQTEQELLDRIAALEEQVRSLLPQPPKVDPVAERMRSLIESRNRAEMGTLKRPIVEKPPEPPEPTINGKSFYGIFPKVDHYQLLTLEELAEMIETTAEAIVLDAERQNIEVHELVKLTTKLQPRLQVDQTYCYMRSPV